MMISKDQSNDRTRFLTQETLTETLHKATDSFDGDSRSRARLGSHETVEFFHHKDPQEVRQEEKSKSKASEVRTKHRWQAQVMIVAAIKYFLISCEIQTGAFYQII